MTIAPANVAVTPSVSASASLPSRTLERLARALRVVAPLGEAAGNRLRCAAMVETASELDLAALQGVVDGLAARLGFRGIEVVSSATDLWSAELAVSEVLLLSELVEPPFTLDAVTDQMLDSAAAAGQVGAAKEVTIASFDGTPLHCYACGEATARAVVVVTACGMPVGLVERWLRHLSASHRVVTWESRDLFGDDGAFDQKDSSTHSQVGDLLAVLEAFDLRDAHVLALCGGVPIALGAAGSARISSMSLWHGDYELGGDAPKTQHQRDVEMLLAMAGRSRKSAAGLHQMFRRPSVLATMPTQLAPWLLYPYANVELLYRYGRLNGAIMGTDCRPLLAQTAQPTLVVTSQDDTTAHPDGSRYAAAHLRAGRLEVVGHGDHLAAFEGGRERLDLATAFIEEVSR